MQTLHRRIAPAARRILMLGMLVGVLLAPGEGAARRPAAPPAPQALTISLEPVADVSALGGQPIAITHANDRRMFITLQEGKIAIFDGAQVLPTPFLDITSIVNSGDTEQGLLSVAFDPQYASNGYFYVDYINKTGVGDTVVARYQRSPSNPNVANPASAHTLLTIAQPQANHNGGQLQFGPDGYLYISTGDGGNFGDQGPGHNSTIGNAQDLSRLLGKILRIDVHNNNTGDGLQYDIPPGNPFASDGDPNTRAEIWAYGLRNPWRFSFDRATGDMLIGDVGQDTKEEVDYQPAGSGGKNYGWRCREADLAYASDSHCATDAPSFTGPILVYDHSQGACAVTGGYRYRGARFAPLAGRYFYGDYCNGQIWAATKSGSQWTATPLRDTSLLISAFGEDQFGELYVADRVGGKIYQIVTPTEITFLPLVRR
jgi:glucose/arabinose dehydrogenase